jgi:NRAMP (natural resistance-associated macrophage protein)-like metal ion transporter
VPEGSARQTIDKGHTDQGIGWRDVSDALGPGLVTGAADDDPSGIATYAQVGAQLGYTMLWTAPLTFPLMTAVQYMCAKIGLATGRGLAGVLKQRYPRSVVLGAVLILLIANTINLGVDIGAIAAAINLFVPIPAPLIVLPVTAALIGLLVFGSYERISKTFKWLTLALFAYVGAALLAQPDWSQVVKSTLVPAFALDANSIVALVAILGTTISPYLFFWQASQEVEEMRLHGVQAGGESRETLRRAKRRMRLDTVIGMTFSNGIAFFVMLTAALVLHGAGVTDVQSAAQAAEALRPLAGDFAFTLFALGIIATGLLAVPVLASSAAYAVAEAFGWPEGLERHWREAKGFYAIIGIATIVGTGLDFTPIDPMQALYWSAVINGVVAVPIMVAMMILAGNPTVMGVLPVKRKTRFFGWGAVAVMAVAVAMMFWDLAR